MTSPRSPYQIIVLKYLVENHSHYRHPGITRIQRETGIPNVSVIPKNLKSLQAYGYLDESFHPTRKGKRLIKELENPSEKTDKPRGVHKNNNRTEE